MAALSTLFPVFFMLALGFVSKIKGWVTPEQKAGANSIVFGVLFPIMIFNLMMGASIESSTMMIVAYVFAVFMISIVLGKYAGRFVSEKYQHLIEYLLPTCEGGNVALPLYLSIVGASSNTVIFDIAGVFTAFVVLPIMVAKQAAGHTSTKDMLKNIFSNSFVIATILGMFFNVTGLYQMFTQTELYTVYSATIAQATAPIVGMILFMIGYDLMVDKETIVPILKMVGLRFAFYALVIAGFFVLFPHLMADKIFLMAVLIYFMCPTGFAMPAIISPIYKNEDDNAFVSAFLSIFMIVTLIVYTCVVLFIA